MLNRIVVLLFFVQFSYAQNPKINDFKITILSTMLSDMLVSGVFQL